MTHLLIFLALQLTDLATADSCHHQAGQSAAIMSLAEIPKNLSAYFERIRLDQTKIREWSDSAVQPCPGPRFRATYQKNGRKLVYLAIDHLQGPARVDSPLLHLIERAVTQVQPGATLTEMGPSGRHPYEALTSISQSCQSADGSWRCGESAYAAVVAGRNGSEIWGGEAQANVLAPLALRRMPPADLAALESTKILLHLKTSGIPLAQWESAFRESFSQRGLSSWVGKWSYSEFRQWLRTEVGKSPEEVQSSWIAPIHGKQASRLQRISHVFEQVREPQILAQIENVINRRGPAMIIYGQAHYYKQSPALEEVFGPPTIECL